jgi:hypothetical protein
MKNKKLIKILGESLETSNAHLDDLLDTPLKNIKKKGFKSTFKAQKKTLNAISKYHIWLERNYQNPTKPPKEKHTPAPTKESTLRQYTLDDLEELRVEFCKENGHDNPSLSPVPENLLIDFITWIETKEAQ